MRCLLQYSMSAPFHSETRAVCNRPSPVCSMSRHKCLLACMIRARGCLTHACLLRPRHAFLVWLSMWELAAAAAGGRLRPSGTWADHRHRKKYFTTSERLRITEKSQNPSRKNSSSHKAHGSGSRSRKATPEPCHISTLPDNWKPNSDRKVKQSMTSSLLRSRRRHSRPNIEQERPVVSEEQAAWFLALPDKVKRQHFSKEEQTLLADRCESVLDRKCPKSSQESAQEFCRRRLDSHAEKESKYKHRRRSSAPVTRALDDKALAEIAAADAPEAVEDGESDKMATLSLYSRRHSVALERELRPEPLVVTKAQIRSFRKSFALRPLALPAPILAPCPSPGFYKARDAQRAAKPKRRPAELVFTPPSPEAKHYKDPEMRRTLRAMSSPELFDEALEYGFPQPPSQHRLNSAHMKSRFSANTSENDRSSSLTSSSTAETKDLPFGAVPSTPDGSTSFLSPMSPMSPRASTGNLASESGQELTSPQLSHRRAHTTGHTPSHSHSRTPSSVNREMTLRMTLTRPMLRSAETDVDAVRLPNLQPPLMDEHDPLALESITVCDDPTGAQGAFAINPDTSQNLKGIKKALKHLVGK